MTKRDNHYEAAFEEYLRRRQVAYVAVDEARRSLWAGALGDSECQSLKSLDFIVPSSAGTKWLVDIKGRQFPSGRQKQYWKNWSTRDDLASLARWERLFGGTFQGLLVFAFAVCGDRAPLAAAELFRFRGGTYAFVGVRLLHYAALARTLSPRWGTVALGGPQFRALAEPLVTLL